MEDVRGGRVPLLQANNYTTWAINLGSFLETKGLWKTVEAGRPAGADDTNKGLDNRARAEIGLCLGDDHLFTWVECKTARSLWQALEQARQRMTRARQQSLTMQLVTLQNGWDEPVAKCLARAEVIRDSMTSAGDGPTTPLLMGLDTQRPASWV